MWRRLWLLYSVLLNGALPAFAQEAALNSALVEKIDVHMEGVLRDLNIPGGAIGIVRGDKVVYLQGYGVADASDRKVTPQTPFLLASVSKSFTALAILQLVESRHIDLGAPVQQYLPWFRVADEAASAQITVSDLLYHRSGFSEYTGNIDSVTFDDRDSDLEDKVRRLASVGLISSPGEAFEYSNINYDILGLLVQTVSGQPYETYIQQHIFDPLNMRHSYTTTNLAAATEDGMTTGFGLFFGTPLGRDIISPRIRVPSAGLISTVEDLSHYMIAQLNGGRYEDRAILSPEGIARTHDAGIQHDLYNGYAMGWNTGVLRAAGQTEGDYFQVPRVVYHDGWWSGFRTQIFLIPAENLGVVTLMNSDDFARVSGYDYAARGAALLMLGIEPGEMQFSDDFLSQYGREITAAVIVIQLILLIAAVIQVRRWKQQPQTLPRLTLWTGLRYLVLPLVFDLALAYIFAVVIPEAFASPLDTILVFSLDIGLMMVIIFALALGWGTIRTILTLLVLRRGARRATFAVVSLAEMGRTSA